MPPKKKKRWTLEKVKKRGITKYIQDPDNPKRKIINAVWRRLAIVYSPECAEEIIYRIRGGEPITRICRRKGMPSYQTICSWMKKFPDLSEEIKRAKKDAQILLHDKMDEDFVEMHEDIEKNDPKIANAKATLYREQIGWRKWSMERMNPEAFSPKIQVDQNVNIRQVSFIIETSKKVSQLGKEESKNIIEAEIIKQVDLGGKLKNKKEEEEFESSE